MMISFFEMSIAAVAAAGAMIILAVAFVAIASKRPGLAAAIGGLFLLTIGFGAMALFWVYTMRSAPTSAIIYEDPTSATTVSLTTPVSQHRNGTTHFSWDVSLIPLKFLFVAAVAFVVIKIVRAAANKPSGGRGNWWPALLLVPLAAFLVLGSVRYQVRSGTEAQVAEVPLPHVVVSPIDEQLRRAAEKTREIQSRIARADIHELMDQSDAPRIPLAPPEPTAPSPPAESPPSEAASAPEPDNANDDAEPKGNDADNVAKVQENKDSGNAKPKDSENEAPAAADESSVAPAASDAAPPVATATQKPGAKPSEAAEVEESIATTIDESSNQNAEPRPKWVDDQPKRVGSEPREVVITDEWASDEEWNRARDIALMLKTYERIQHLIGAPYQGNILDHRMNSANSWSDHRLRQLACAGITLDWVHRAIAQEEYLETVQHDFGPMKKSYTLVEFSPAVDNELRQHWRAYERRERFEMFGAGAGSVLGLIGLAYGLLRFDTYTKGYYTKPLFLGVSAAIIGALLFLTLISVI
jgi:hypothetical protein